METSKKILALDSSGLVASVAVVEGNSTYSNLLAEYTVNYKKTHSQTLLPMLDEIANMTELDLTTIDAIAIAAGPGSFTGLRIGSATAIMDARRNQVYTGIYEFRGNTMEVLEPQMAVDIEVIAEKLCERQQEVIFLGDGVPVFKDKLCNGLMDKLHDCGKEFYFAPAHVNKQRAGAVGALALRYLEEGKTETAEEHQPEYLRMAQAERERAEKLAKGEGTC